MPASVTAGVHIRVPLKLKNRDSFRLRADDPIFRYAGFGVVVPLFDQIPLGLVIADDFQRQVGAKPKTILPALVGCRKQHHDVGLAVLL